MDIDLTEKVTDVWGRILSWIPDILGALLILLIGYFIAIILRSLTIKAMRRVQLNKKIREAKGGNFFKKISDDPSALVGSIVYWLIWIIILTIALPILNIPVINQLIFGFYAYLPNILASIIILAIASILAALIDTIVLRLFGDTPTGKIIATVTPALIITIAVFMVLVQLKIATSIVIITYGAIWGALALGFALAFGLGGRELAAKILGEAYQRGRENMNQVRSDLAVAKERGRQEAEKIKNEIE